MVLAKIVVVSLHEIIFQFHCVKCTLHVCVVCTYICASAYVYSPKNHREDQVVQVIIRVDVLK